MAKYLIHDWYYRGARSFPPGSIVEIPDKEEPHPDWERVTGDRKPKGSRAPSRAKDEGNVSKEKKSGDEWASAEEGEKKPKGNTLRPADVGV